MYKRQEHMEIEIPADVKEQIFEYANLIGEEEKVRTLVRNLTDAINQADEDQVEELLDDAKMDIQDLPDPTIGKLELRDYGYTADDIDVYKRQVSGVGESGIYKRKYSGAVYGSW